MLITVARKLREIAHYGSGRGLRDLLTCQICTTKPPLLVENDLPVLEDDHRAGAGQSLQTVSPEGLVPPAGLQCMP